MREVFALLLPAPNNIRFGLCACENGLAYWIITLRTGHEHIFVPWMSGIVLSLVVYIDRTNVY
jgi:hypothetical protein